ncbi:MAG: Atxe2 family lasso peptide isopeptidase [Phenylobacterium sp.]|uniref:Atxe2 family lasso peptide isopeptidase n=1 Tax=Phenylobacterium sp. TaxID=1871053 RepID=UPI00273370EB|nr:Atxe2 family lasso peptide isopeptidase [Phenylobacterium sp.]MDP3749278.1 Atxe2 family lasso peptide isopeptidase [Phenylobacterium sp.]
MGTDDLLRLRDFGGLSVSPDGRWLAFSLRQARPERDDYVVRWFVAPTSGASLPSPLDVSGGDPIQSYVFGLPRADILSAPAKWSPDGRWFAFRRRAGTRIELWVGEPRSRHAKRVADGVSQVTGFAWSRDGVLVFRTGLNHDLYRRNLEIEAQRGWLLDSRMPLSAARTPEPTEPDCLGASPDPACDVRTFAADIKGGARPATEAEIAALAEELDPGSRVPGAFRGKTGAVGRPRSDGAIAWAENADPDKETGFAPLRRIATNAAGARRCDARDCTGSIRSVGWARGGASIWFLKREGGAGRADGAPRDEAALYEWRPSSEGVRQVLRTTDLIDDCHVRGAVAYCGRETVTRPRHIVAVKLDTGEVRTLYDANPTFTAKAFPKVRKLMLSDFEGNPAFAHVVYPYDYRPGRAYPLVVVQYISKGFLRGGTGSEYPIYPLAAEGFIVLSVDRPEPWDRMRRLSLREVERSRLGGDLRDRRSVLGVIEQAIDALVAEGLVDDRRLAITGLSSGAEIVHYALQHSRRFAAGIASSGIHDQTFLAIVPEGADRTRLMEAFSSETIIPPEDNPIAQLSWSRMPERLKTPLLINAGQHEVMIGFEGIEALRHAKRPVEMRVFPDELHVKYHPRSLAGVYANNMEWLKFWLMGYEDPNPELSEQYRRWRDMKARLEAEVRRP